MRRRGRGAAVEAASGCTATSSRAMVRSLLMGDPRPRTLRAAMAGRELEAGSPSTSGEMKRSRISGERFGSVRD